ncbi:Uncharacterised protein [Mycobacterium tuberculosis]|nr:Uncharacterised protein [Mycobacterium tuberculosis]
MLLVLLKEGKLLQQQLLICILSALKQKCTLSNLKRLVLKQENQLYKYLLKHIFLFQWELKKWLI